MTEREAMTRALELALRGWGRVAPNPLVGAVLVRDGDVAGEGAHLEFGGPHAEVVALEAAGEAARGATCVVNLEPCAHHGKTPPCVDALIGAGVTRVVMAGRDPHREAGGGAGRLREAGIEVEIGLLEHQAAALNAAFLWTQVRHERPFVALKVATSLDGFLSDAAGRSQWISGPQAREYVQWLRAGFDAIAVGRGTIQADDPLLTVRGPVEPRVPPIRVIFVRDGLVTPDRRVVQTAGSTPTVIVTTFAAQDRIATAMAGTGVTVLGVEGLEAGFEALRHRDVRSVLVEGGGTLAHALLDANLIDRLYWIQAPIWLGTGEPAFGKRPGTPLGTAPRWVVTERQALGDDTLLVVDRTLCLPGS